MELDHHPDQIDLEEAIESECKPFCGLRRDYGALCADPPWQFLTRSDKGKGKSPEQHYSCLSIDDIKALPVSKLAAKDSVLFLWVTDTHLQIGLDVMKAWDFEYKTIGFNWAKLRKSFDPLNPDPVSDSAFHFGMGFWTRANPEICLLGTRGSPKRLDAGVRRLVVEPVREHSRKPDTVYRRIQKLVAGPYLELFARTSDRPNWDAWGDDTEHFK